MEDFKNREELIEKLVILFLEINQNLSTNNDLIKWIKFLEKGISYTKQSLRQEPNDDIEEFLAAFEFICFQFKQNKATGKILKQFVTRTIWIDIKSIEINRLETGIIVRSHDITNIKEYLQICKRLFLNKIKIHLPDNLLDVNMSIACIFSKSEEPNEYSFKIFKITYALIVDCIKNVNEWYDYNVCYRIKEKLHEFSKGMPSLNLVKILYVKFNILTMNNNDSSLIDFNTPFEEHKFVKNNNCMKVINNEINCNYCKTLAFYYHMLYQAECMYNPVPTYVPMEF